MVLDGELLQGWQSYSLEFNAEFIDQYVMTAHTLIGQSAATRALSGQSAVTHYLSSMVLTGFTI